MVELFSAEPEATASGMVRDVSAEPKITMPSQVSERGKTGSGVLRGVVIARG
jgi:hypothetical protein